MFLQIWRVAARDFIFLEDVLTAFLEALSRSKQIVTVIVIN